MRHIEPWFDKRFNDDSFANRKGKGTHAAIARLQHFMRQPGHRWYCKLDVRAFFPSIDRQILLGLWRAALPRLPFDSVTLGRLDQVASAGRSRPFSGSGCALPCTRTRSFCNAAPRGSTFWAASS